MGNLALNVYGLGKQFRIGKKNRTYNTLRDQIAEAIYLPFSRTFNLLRGQPYGASDLSETIWALRNITFKVNHGEVVGIIGRNGAGKSTLLKILSRISEPTEGYAETYGRVGALLEVGTGFHPELTGRENIFLNGAILGMTRREIRLKFDEIVAFAEVEKFLDTPVKHYSSGMGLRLGFSVAAHLEPEILIVDEVLAVGDLQFQRKCLGKMHEVSTEGRTVLFVSHNMSAVTSLCSRAILLQDGRIIADGHPIEVVETYTLNALGMSGTLEWENLEQSPGTQGFKLVGMTLLNNHNEPVGSLDIEQTAKISLKYYTEVPRMRFRCALMFYTQGVCAFTTMETAEVERLESGYYISTLELPANLFAEGDYSVGISVFASRGKKVHLCQIRDAIAFQVYDLKSGKSSRGDYSEGLSGVVRPLLNWDTNYFGIRQPESVSANKVV